MSNTIQCPLCKSEIAHSYAFEEQIKGFLKNKDEQNKKIEEYEIQLSNFKTREKQIRTDEQTKAREEIEKNNEKFKAEILQKVQLEADKKAEQKYKDTLQNEKERYILQGASNEKIERDKEKLEYEKKEKAWQIDRKRNQRKLEEMSNRLKSSKNVELKGEAQEVLIQQYIEEKYPNFEVIPVPKGAKGDDIHIKVKDSKGKTIGSFGIESKNVAKYSQSWEEKLTKDIIKHKLDCAILVTSSMPPNKSAMFWTCGNKVAVVEMNIKSLYITIDACIMHIFEISKTRKMVGLSNTKQGELYKRISSQGVAMEIREHLILFAVEQKQIDKDSTSHEMSRNFRLKNLEDKKNSFRRIFSKIAGGDEKLSSALLNNNDENNNILTIEREN